MMMPTARQFLCAWAGMMLYPIACKQEAPEAEVAASRSAQGLRVLRDGRLEISLNDQRISAVKSIVVASQRFRAELPTPGKFVKLEPPSLQSTATVTTDDSRDCVLSTQGVRCDPEVAGQSGRPVPSPAPGQPGDDADGSTDDAGDSAGPSQTTDKDSPRFPGAPPEPKDDGTAPRFPGAPPEPKDDGTVPRFPGAPPEPRDEEPGDEEPAGRANGAPLAPPSPWTDFPAPSN